jgi:hypothetical protein
MLEAGMDATTTAATARRSSAAVGDEKEAWRGERGGWLDGCEKVV